jgi:hypothetical protein
MKRSPITSTNLEAMMWQGRGLAIHMLALVYQSEDLFLRSLRRVHISAVNASCLRRRGFTGSDFIHDRLRSQLSFLASRCMDANLLSLQELW